MGTRARVAAGTSRPVLDRKGAKAAKLDTVAFRHGVGDLAEDRVDDILDVALVEMGILGGNALDEF
jgi:hypothetical protein